MKKVGIMTFHAAYNYGSVLQAYATQRVLMQLGYKNEIINYRLKNQKDYYDNNIVLKFGRNELIRRILCLCEYKDRCIRAEKFEMFIINNLKLSASEYNSYKALYDAELNYPILFTGSDQVWNRHCTAEFKTEPQDSIKGYFLEFGEKNAKRIAFSASIGAMSAMEMEEFKDALNNYSFISMRESDSADIIEGMLKKTISNTLDPTLLIKKSEWLKLCSNGKYDFAHYILVYTLVKKNRHLWRRLRIVKKYADKRGMKVICLSPFTSISYPGIYMDNSCGPQEFLYYIKNADLVVTDSFHGTAFSANLETPFFTINHGKDQRKKLLLERISLEERLIMSIDDLLLKNDYSCTFDMSRQILEELREDSVFYLKKALND